MAPHIKSESLSFAIICLMFLTTQLHQTCGQLTIPKRSLGFVYNKGGSSSSVNAPITLSFYIDNTCPDSQAAYPTMLKVVDHFGPQTVKLVTHLFPLPYHRNSHTIAKGAHVIDAFSNGTATYAWFKIAFDNFGKLTTSATAKLTDDGVMDILTPLAQSVSHIPASKFRDGVYDRTIDSDTRLGWKYGCTRGVYGTPFFMLNDVVVSADPTWSVDQWVKVIEPLLR